MTTVLDIIQNAYRESNLIPIGDVPTEDQTVEGLFLLQNLVSSVVGNEAGQPLSAVTLGSSNVSVPDRESIYAWPSNAFVSNLRLNLDLTASVAISLHPNPRDGARIAVMDVAQNLSTYPVTLKGNGRRIEGSTSLVLNTDGLSREWFYRADLGDWRPVLPIALTDDFPFPPEFNDLFITYLAVRLDPRQGVSTAPESVQAMKRSLSQFRARYKQYEPMPSELALLLTSASKYRNYSDSTSFATGRMYYFSL